MYINPLYTQVNTAVVLLWLCMGCCALPDTSPTTQSSERIYGALPHGGEPSPSEQRAPGQPPNWTPQRVTSTSKRIYGVPPGMGTSGRAMGNRSSADSDADRFGGGVGGGSNAGGGNIAKRKRVVMSSDEDEDDVMVKAYLPTGKERPR